ncbi:MAG: hypothetical protein AAFV72_00165 [Cyanobacteria bacterium J06635_1]
MTDLKLIGVTNVDGQLTIDYSLALAKAQEFRADVAELADAVQCFSDKWLAWMRPIIRQTLAVIAHWCGVVAGIISRQVQAQVRAGLATEQAQEVIAQVKHRRETLLGRAACYRARVEDVAAVAYRPALHFYRESRAVAIAAGSESGK